MVRRLAPIVPPGAFTNQLRPNPHILSQKKPQKRNEKPVLVEMEREREWGDEKVMYSIILLKEDLDNRWITAVCRYKGNRGWQRHQERSEKIALTSMLRARVCQNFVAVICFKAP